MRTLPRRDAVLIAADQVRRRREPLDVLAARAGRADPRPTAPRRHPPTRGGRSTPGHARVPRCRPTRGDPTRWTQPGRWRFVSARAGAGAAALAGARHRPPTASLPSALIRICRSRAWPPSLSWSRRSPTGSGRASRAATRRGGACPVQAARSEARAQAAAGALERAVGGRHAGRQRGGGFVRGPAEDVAHHEGGLLARRQMLDRGQQRELERLAGEHHRVRPLLRRAAVGSCAFRRRAR